MKFAFYVSRNAGRLLKFLQQASSIEKEQIVLVVSEDRLPSSLVEILQKNDIKYQLYEYEELDGYGNQEKNLELSNLMLRAFAENRIDYCFCFGRHILGGQLLERYHNRIINFHPAILPMFPGNKAIDQAVASNSVFLIGNTAHFINEELDSGPIIMQSVIPIQSFYDSGNDYDAILDIQIEMLKKIMNLLENDRIVVEGHIVRIIGANYDHGHIFPQV